MNIDRSPGDFQRAGAVQPGPVGRAWAGVKGWSARNPRLSRVVWFALGLVLLALLIWAIYPGKQNNRRGAINQGAQPVGIARAISGDINVTLNGLGTVTPLATATVRPQVGGMLVKLNFTEGQMVKAGDTLAQIDPRPYQAALDQVRGQLAKDTATLANAKVDLQRYQVLLAQNAISQQQVATQAALVQSTQGVVVADQANVESARINLGYTNIVSPVSGRGHSSGGYRQYRAGQSVYRHRGGDPASAHVGAVHHSRRQCAFGVGTRHGWRGIAGRCL